MLRHRLAAVWCAALVLGTNSIVSADSPAAVHASASVLLDVSQVATLAAGVFVKDRSIGPQRLQDAMAEAELVWQMSGLQLRWTEEKPGDSATAAPLRIIVGDTCPAGDGRTAPLAYIPFIASDPVPRIVLCYANARALLARVRTDIDVLPARIGDALVARMMGRAIAHEIGHYLLGREHTRGGLMRARRTIDDLTNESRADYSLAEEERRRALDRARELGLSH